MLIIVILRNIMKIRGEESIVVDIDNNLYFTIVSGTMVLSSLYLLLLSA